ncbi:hypothetical protein N0K71_06715 [Dellaglioa algida]|uniref:hypothetical protein n=1 Tax=Dellaglioa algida TaxID=105612 RepID=UPI0007172CF8|nr:hypothetical protein [Dellaglioa algida]MDK1733316.1 hypothetical protein [Dellaglioa algida]MDK1734767.1 hypothetical protein [Dellaglioa algida]
MDKFKLRYVCENCGKIGFYHNEEEAFQDGWDYPPKMGTYQVIGPRTCGNCPITSTLFWALNTGQVKSFDDMSLKQRVTLIRILGEPGTILGNEY